MGAGVYSTERNALRAARAASEAGGEAVRCGVYRFGDKFMVSLFRDGRCGCGCGFRADARRAIPRDMAL